MDVISRIYRSKGGKKKIKEVPTHTIHYGYIYDGEELIDEVLVMIMHAPRTFTGEDPRQRLLWMLYRRKMNMRFAVPWIS